MDELYKAKKDIIEKDKVIASQRIMLSKGPKLLKAIKSRDARIEKLEREIKRMEENLYENAKV